MPQKNTSKLGRKWSLALKTHTFFSYLLILLKWAKQWLGKYEHLTLPGVFSYKATPDIDFTVEALVQCDDDGDIKMIENEFDVSTSRTVSRTNFVYCFSFLRN